MPRSVWLVLLAVLLLLCAAPVWGQSQNGSLSGQVTDKTGAAIPQASVSLKFHGTAHPSGDYNGLRRPLLLSE